jgi:hypothetical protein
MSDFENRTSRSNIFAFANGTAHLLVDHWGGNDKTEANRAIDHLMGTLLRSVTDVAQQVNQAIADIEAPDGDVRHTSTRSMAINGVSMRVKVTLVFTREVPSRVLASAAAKILASAENCMLHLIDPSVFDDVAGSLMGIIQSSMADMPADIKDALFGPGSPFGGTDEGSPYESAGYRH